MRFQCGNCDSIYEKEFDELPCCPRCNPKPGNVKNQSHYTQFKIQPATFVAANGLDYFQGNVIKYVMRYKQKNGVEDLKKAAHYIEMMIQLVETGEVKP